MYDRMFKELHCASKNRGLGYIRPCHGAGSDYPVHNREGICDRKPGSRVTAILWLCIVSQLRRYITSPNYFRMTFSLVFQLVYRISFAGQIQVMQIACLASNLLGPGISPVMVHNRLSTIQILEISMQLFAKPLYYASLYL